MTIRPDVVLGRVVSVQNQGERFVKLEEVRPPRLARGDNSGPLATLGVTMVGSG
jgi:hypothetical protein